MTDQQDAVGDDAAKAWPGVGWVGVQRVMIAGDIREARDHLRSDVNDLAGRLANGEF